MSLGLVSRCSKYHHASSGLKQDFRMQLQLLNTQRVIELRTAGFCVDSWLNRVVYSTHQCNFVVTVLLYLFNHNVGITAFVVTVLLRLLDTKRALVGFVLVTLTFHGARFVQPPEVFYANQFTGECSAVDCTRKYCQ